MSPDKPDPPYKALMDAQHWESIYKQLYVFLDIHYPDLDKQARKELVAEAVFKVYTQARPWDPQSGHSIITHLKWTMRSILSNTRAKKSAKDISWEYLKETGEGETELAPLSGPSIEELAETEDNIKELLNRVSGDSDCEMVLLAILDGHEKVADISKATEISVERVIDAMKRLPRLLSGR
ncbi:MAG TPA: hypothetical protein VGL38_01745 [bacterium]|jgi:hypothetical protein